MPMEQSADSNPSVHVRYADRVFVERHAGGEVCYLPVATPDVVSFHASFLSLPEFGTRDSLVRDLTVSMLDKGTKKRTKGQLAQALEGMGAHLNFTTDGIRVRVSGKSLRRHLPAVLEIMAEELEQPDFPPEELELLKGRYEGAFRHSLMDTGSAASGALTRHVYDKRHPNYVENPLLEIDRLAAISQEDIRAYYASKLNPADFRMSLVGDIEGLNIRSELSRVVTLSSPDGKIQLPDWACIDYVAGKDEVYMEDRENIDVRWGMTVPLVNTDPDFLPLYLANYILGGNFSARLMTEIRDRQGLTYGIHASMSGVDVLHHGMWLVSVTLSRSNLKRGIDETMKQIRIFVDHGVTESELQEKKTTVSGSFKVGLSSTGALAGTLLRNAEKGRDPGYLDRFPRLIEEMEVATVNDIISRYMDPERLHTAIAGTFTGDTPDADVPEGDAGATRPA